MLSASLSGRKRTTPPPASGPAGRRWRWLLLALTCLTCWLALAGATRAAAPLPLDERATYPQMLGERGLYWLDPTGRASADDVARRPAASWQPTQTDRIYPLGEGRAVWLRLRIAPRPTDTHWYLDIPFANLDRATLYTQDAAGQWRAHSAGDRLPVADWAVPGRQPVLPLALSSSLPTEHLLRIEHGYPTSVPILLTEEHQLLTRERLVALGLGVYVGLTLLAMVVALAAALWLRDAASALFVVPTLLLGLSASTFAGVSGWLLWPHQAIWNDRSAAALPLLALVAMLAFVSVATAFGTRAPRLRHAPWALAAAGVALAAALPVLPGDVAVPATAALYSLLLLACLGVPAWAWWRGGDRHALGLLIGMSCLAAPAITHVLGLTGLLPTGLVSRYALLSGSALQLAVVLVTLIWRGRDRSLTRQRMRGLDRVDPATGLATRAAVRDHLRRMTARAQQQRHAYALLLIDLINLGEARRRFGRRAEQELPLRLADRLLTHTRAIDVVGRLGETRFVMLLDGPLDAAGASRLAHKVLSACQQPHEAEADSRLPRVRMALGLLPRDGLDPDQVLDKLAIQLDTVAPGDARALFQLA